MSRSHGLRWQGVTTRSRTGKSGSGRDRRVRHRLLAEQLESRQLLSIEPTADLWEQCGAPSAGSASSGGTISPPPISAPVKAGNEFRVNTTTALDQRFWEPTPEAAAMDADGDFVITWSSQSQDGDGWGVFAQRFSANGTPQGAEFQVNSIPTANQRYATAAMDPDGDFIITWSAMANETDNTGIYARRFNAAGVAQGPEFLVSPEQNRAAQRLSVASMDAEGNFVVAWSELDPVDPDNISNVWARMFDAEGVPEGPAFRVNVTEFETQRQASISRNEQGQFVIVWRSRDQDGDRDGVFARIFDKTGTPLTGELQVNQFTTGLQIQATVAMEPSGGFIVTWYNRLPGPDEGNVPRDVYARRFNADGSPRGNEFRVNTSTFEEQRYSHVAVDQDGDFVIVWASYMQDGSDFGIYAQAYDASGAAVGSEFRVNTTTTGRQSFPVVAMDDEGDFVVAWQSLSQDGDGYGIYAQRFSQPQGFASPHVTGVYNNGDDHLVSEGERLVLQPTQLVVAYSESMLTGGVTGSVTNKANWLLTKNGVPANELISSVSFAFNTALNRYEATMTFTSSLTEGEYTLTARETQRDLTSRGLDGNRDGIAGGDYQRSFRISLPLVAGDEFRVNTTTAGDQYFSTSGPGTVAMDDEGNFIVVWTSAGQDGNGSGVYAQRYFANGAPNGGEFLVNTQTAFDQRLPSVAVRANQSNGEFIITWASASQDGSGEGVYAQRFAGNGTKVGGEFLVNTTTNNSQTRPNVAMDDGGNFIIAWESIGQDGAGLPGVYFQRYDASGTPVGVETRANTFTVDSQRLPQVAMDADGDFVITWSSNLQDGSGYGVYARRYTAEGVPLAGEFRANTVTSGKQQGSSVAMDADGDFVIVWESENVDGSSDAVVLQRYSANGTPIGANQTVNVVTSSAQRTPTVAIDNDGDVVVTWQSLLQDGNSWGVYARRMAWNGAFQAGEFQVNQTTANAQLNPNVAVDADGDFVVAWASAVQDGSGQGIYARRFREFVNTPPVADAGGPYEALEGSSITFNAGGSFDPDPGQSLTYAWDIDNDGAFDDAVGVGPTLTGAQLAALGLNNNGSYTVRVRVLDTSGASAVDSATVTLLDVAPHDVTVSPLSPTTEGSTVVLNGSFIDPGLGELHTVTVNWGDGVVDVVQLAIGARTFSASHQYLDDNPTGTPADQYPVTVTVSGDGATSQPAGTMITVANVAPQITVLNRSSSTVVEGSVLTLTGTFTDPGALDTHAVLINWGDGTASTGTVNEANKTFTATHVYGDEEPTALPTIVVTLTDDDGGASASQTSVTVTNASPQIGSLQLSSTTINEGGAVTLTGSYSDAGALDTHTILVGWGDGIATIATLNPANKTFTATHTYQDDSPTGTPSDVYPINVTVSDDDNGVGAGQTTLTVQNVAPSNVVIDPIGEATEGEPVTLTARFTDVGTLDTHVAEIQWGDGAIETIPLIAGAREFSATHTYNSSNGGDPFEVIVKITDDDGGVGSASAQLAIGNIPPTIAGLVASPDPVAEGSDVTLIGNVIDSGTTESHEVLVDWGDGTSSSVAAESSILFVVPVERNDPSTPVLMFELDENGNAVQLPSIPTNENTQLADPLASIFSPTGELFVSNRHGNSDVGSISRFRVLADGSFFFNGVITGNSLAGVHDLAFSPTGELFAANRSNGLISRFVFDAGGNAIANGTIQGPPLVLGLAFSDTGELFANSYTVVNRYTFDNNGNASPNGSFSVQGETSLQLIEFGPSNELFIPTFDSSDGEVYRYKLEKNGNLAPNGFIPISGSAAGVAFTPDGEMFVTSQNGDVRRFTFDLNGNAVPNGTLAFTGLGAPTIYSTRTFTATHQYLDDNPTGTPSDVYQINVTVTDGAGGEGQGAMSVTVANVAPEVQITGIPIVINVGQPFQLQALATDVGTLDTVTFAWQVLRDGEEVALGAGPTLTFTPTQTGPYVFRLFGTDDDSGIGVTEITLEAEPCLVPGDTNGDCAVNLADLNNVRNHFGESGLSSVNLSFNAQTPGTLADKDGLGTGFTHRLPGTGTAFPANDPNLDLEPGANGRLRIRSTQADPAGVSLDQLEAPGILHEGVAGADFDISTTFFNVQVPTGSDQLQLYVGVNGAQLVHAGFHAGGVYRITSNNGREDAVEYESPANAFLPGDNVILAFSRIDGVWTLQWENLTSGVRSGQSTGVSLPWLDGEENLTIGVLYARPTEPTPLIATIDNFAVDVRRPVVGDTNGDFLVDLADLNAVRNNFGAVLGAPAASQQNDGVYSQAADAVFAQWTAARATTFPWGGDSETTRKTKVGR